MSIEKKIDAADGAIVGWSFETAIAAVNKIQMINKSISTPVPSIVQVGQWSYSRVAYLLI